ncbi:hypothetical protein N7447_003533, partial [Penicillium robsamsonii]|uniref:uncharacterized protein n=1 Tax=Penicillium robsamsonii TaxID=1792511 RepID=UPI002546A9C6
LYFEQAPTTIASSLLKIVLGQDDLSKEWGRRMPSFVAAIVITSPDPNDDIVLGTQVIPSAILLVPGMITRLRRPRLPRHS